MEKCLVCTHEFPRKGNLCPRCGWPIGVGSTPHNPRTDADVINWAAHMYRQLVKMHEQQQGVSSNTEAGTPQTDISIGVLEARVQQLIAELHNLNSTYIQERHRSNGKIDGLSKEIEFFKEIIQKDRVEIAKISTLERQYREISQFIAIPQMPSGSLAGPVDKTLLPETIPDQPIALPMFESISEQTQPVLNEVKIPLSPTERDLIDLYNRSQDIPESIRQGAIDVSIDADALNRLRDGDVSPITFVIDRKGNFLVVRRGGYQYLVPNKKRPINSHIHKTVKSIYTCEGYYENYEQFVLVRPALVEEITITEVVSRGENRWQLGQKGILKFK
jgi:hypothetical protein